MLNFKIDGEACTGCGTCVEDCPALIISMDDGLPGIEENIEQYCIRCMHCVAVCPEGAVSIHEYSPEQGDRFEPDRLPDPASLELLIKGRRSIRAYRDTNVDSALIDKILEVASHAPSGHNDRGLLYTLIDDKDGIDALRDEVFTGVEKRMENGTLPKDSEMFREIIEMWKMSGKDILFRGAPHLLVVSAPEDNAAPLHDAVIALTTFELYARDCGLGTIWNGLATLVISELVPELRDSLGIPKDHRIGYVMGFGFPDVHYARTIERGAPRINRVRK
jgi:ferredoxin